MPLRGCPVLCSAGQRMLFCGGSFEGRRSAAQSPSFSEKHKNALDGGGAPRRRSGAEHKRKLSRLDRIFTLIHSNRVVSRIGGNGKLWPEGWGNAELLTQLEETHARRRSRDRCGMLYDVGGSTARIGALPPEHPEHDAVPAISWRRLWNAWGGESVWEGEFLSPVQDGSLPPESSIARCQPAQLLLPRTMQHPEDSRGLGPNGSSGTGPNGSSVPAWIHLAGTGDRTFALRRHTALPLAREGAAALILESPFYGGLRPAPRAPRPAWRRAVLMRARAGLNLSPKPKLRTKLKPGLEPCTRRKPAGQRGPKLRRVVDLLALGNATIEETLALARWLRAGPFGRVGVAGFSMGGVHALMAAACSREAMAVAAFMAPRSAAAVFCHGALADACDWEALARSPAPPSAGRAGGDGDGAGSPRGCEEARAELERVLAFTDVSLLPAPRAPHAAVLLQAAADAYVDPDSAEALRAAWGAEGRAAEVRTLSGGHVNAFFTGQDEMRRAMRDAMLRLEQGDTGARLP